MTLIERSSVNNSVNTITRDVTADARTHYPGKMDFVLTVGISYSDHSLLDDYFKDYIELVVQTVHFKLGDDGTPIETIRDLELEVCGDKFPYLNDVTTKYYKYTNFL